MAAPPPFPSEAIRDLLGLLRAMYRAEKRRAFPGARKLKALETFGRTLQQALALAATHDAGTAPHERAAALAEGVVCRLADVVDVTDPALPVLEEAGRRVRSRRKPKQGLPDWAVGARRKGGG